MMDRLIDRLFGGPYGGAMMLPKYRPHLTLDKRWFNERIVVTRIPQDGRDYQRHLLLKAWVDTDHYRRIVIVEVDLDDWEFNIETYR